MARKKTLNHEETPELLKFREKRKWQINLRRYVLRKQPCPFYAPYFGLDIKNIRQWFKCQFEEGMGWDDFGKKWQFDHIIPVTYFDFGVEDELRLCWNFINLRVGHSQKSREGGDRLDVLTAKNYFKELFETTGYGSSLLLLQKIEKIEMSAFINTKPQQAFIKDQQEYLESIKNYTAFEFELLNTGRSQEEVIKELEFLRNLGK